MPCRHDATTIVEDHRENVGAFSRNLSQRIDAMHHGLDIVAQWPDSRTKRRAACILRRRLRSLEQEAGL